MDTARTAYYDSIDDATLLAMSQGGDPAASQTLARRTMFSNPIAALDLYRTAVGQGSVYAVLKVADTLSFFADIRGYGLTCPDRGIPNQLQQLRQNTPLDDLNAEAYATMLAAIADGGPPVTDDETARIGSAHWKPIPCARRSRKRMPSRIGHFAGARHGSKRGNGVPPLSMRPPPVFFSPAGSGIAHAVCNEHSSGRQHDESRRLHRRTRDGRLRSRVRPLYMCAMIAGRVC